jgi:uncharacterized membrane protein (UPF0127 family)
MKTIFRIVVLFLCGGLSLHAQFALEPLDRFPQARLVIFTPDMRKHEFKVWIADTEARREQGLMFVKSLPADQGMLFIFDRLQRETMWMKNTLISLDMLFITADGHIESIAANTKPMSERIISSKGIVQLVLELNGGVAARQEIREGAVVKLVDN